MRGRVLPSIAGVCGVAGLLSCGSALLQAQVNLPVAAGPPIEARTAAPYDITGYWVSVVTEDWRWRMFTPPKGDYASVPLNPDGRKIADAWNPAQDESSGNQCKGYGAAAIMRIPGRIRITWVEGNTMKMETDAGTQTRVFHFGNRKAPDGLPEWQGDSTALWDEMVPSRGGLALVPPTREVNGHSRGTLKVVTRNMRAGYLRKNGVPYSDQAVLTEHYDLTQEPGGDSWLWVTSIVEDPRYLLQPFVTSTHWKKQRDASGWDPTPCSAR